MRFRANIKLTILALIIFGFFLKLGFWQLHRAEEKKAILAKLQTKLASKPILLQQLSKEKSQWQYQPVVFQGDFLNQQQFLLDNRVYKGRAGYEVLTPVQVAGLAKLVLVNRGFIPASVNRSLLPKLNPVFGLQTIHGIIRMPLGKALVLKSDDLTKAFWPKRIQRLDFPLIAQWLKKPVYPFVVLLDKNDKHGFVREWTFINMQPKKHIGYAVQWFVFAFVLFIIYMALAIRRKN